MPFVKVYKAKRRGKSRKLPWQDTRPPEPELRDAYAIARRYQRSFQLSFQAVTRKFRLSVDEHQLRSGLRNVDLNQALMAFPFFNSAQPETVEVWQRYANNLMRSYEGVINEAGEDAMKRGDFPFKFHVEKQEERLTDISVPPNPYSIKWIEEEAARLIQDISLSQQKMIRELILRGFERGERIEDIMQKLLDPKLGRIGLLEREEKAVQNLVDSMIASGAPEESIRKAEARKSKKLLSMRAERIARSETIDAQSKGLEDAWRVTQEAGGMEPETMKEWSAANESDRTCKICQDLNGQQVPLGEPFWSDVLNRSIDRPIAHPSCRCTMLLVVPEP
jgi:hypothetical protein